MNLGDISNGSLCIIDTRVLLYADTAFQKVTEIKLAMPSDIH